MRMFITVIAGGALSIVVSIFVVQFATRAGAPP